MASYDPLWRAIEHALRVLPDDLQAAIRDISEDHDLPPPWETWTLFGLVRHRRRQLWVGEVVTSRLQGDLQAIAAMGAFGHPTDIPQSGLVPGLTEWEYYFHGRGCCLTHRGTGESIDVDFFGPTAEYFDPYFYLRYLRELQAPEPVEARVIALHASFDAVRLAVETLQKTGALEPLSVDRSIALRISETVLEHEAAIDRFCAAWADPGRSIWLAAAIGDWLAAHDAALHAGDPAIIELTAARAAECRKRRTRQILAGWDDDNERGERLMALDDLDSEALAAHLGRALRGPIGGLTSRAMAIINRRNDPAWCLEIRDLLDRLDPRGEIPNPHLWTECQRFLLAHGFLAAETKRALSRAGGTEVGEAALLAMEHDPGRALPLFRRALRSPIPMNRVVAAAILALIDRPWSRRELLAVLRETTDLEATAECRAALRECHDEAARQAALDWEAANPREPEPGPWISMREVALRNAPNWVQSRMEALHDRVMRVRDREPGEAEEPGPSALGRLASWFSARLRRARHARR